VLHWTEYTPPIPVEIIHEGASIAGKGNLAFDTTEGVRELPVLIVGHFVGVGLAVPAGAVRVRRVAIEEGVRTVIALNDLDRRGVLNLHTEEPLRDEAEIFDSAQPAGHGARHPSAAGQAAVGPSSRAGGLRQAGPNLTGADVETSGALQIRKSGGGLVDGALELLARKRGEADLFDEPFLLITKHPEEGDNFAIDIVVGLDRRRLPIDEHSS